MSDTGGSTPVSADLISCWTNSLTGSRVGAVVVAAGCVVAVPNDVGGSVVVGTLLFNEADN